MAIDILGVKVEKISLAETLARIKHWLAKSGQNLIVTVNPEFVLAAQKNKSFRAVLNSASLATADGFGLILAGLILKGEKLSRVTGADLSSRLLLGACPEARIFLLGGAEGVALAVRAKYLNESIVGAESGGMIIEGDWELENNNEVISHINSSGANLLLVAFGQVKQEMWLAKNLSKLPGVKVAIGIGGTFDYLSGLAKRAPAELRAFGFEWLYRLIKEPKRWKRIWRATVVFGWLVIKEKFRI